MNNGKHKFTPMQAYYYKSIQIGKTRMRLYHKELSTLALIIKTEEKFVVFYKIAVTLFLLCKNIIYIHYIEFEIECDLVWATNDFLNQPDYIYCCLKKGRHYHLVASRIWTEKIHQNLKDSSLYFSFRYVLKRGFFGVL